MGLLDWIREKRKGAAQYQGGGDAPQFDLREHGHTSLAGLAAEIRRDERLAKERDETGREPEDCKPGTRRGRGKSWER